jgi:hypothetical protein
LNIDLIKKKKTFVQYAIFLKYYLEFF